jgi:hypothetical protein
VMSQWRVAAADERRSFKLLLSRRADLDAAIFLHRVSVDGSCSDEQMDAGLAAVDVEGFGLPRPTHILTSPLAPDSIPLSWTSGPAENTSCLNSGIERQRRGSYCLVVVFVQHISLRSRLSCPTG